MNTQTDCIAELFGTDILHKSESQKAVDGIAAAESHNKRDVDIYRQYAKWYCHANQSRKEIQIPNVVWADVVRKHYLIKTLSGRRSNNFMGSLFRNGEFRKVREAGEIKSKTYNSHGNSLKLWTLPVYYDKVLEYIGGMVGRV